MMKSRKSEKRVKLKDSPLQMKGKKDKLLARWTDGLFYFVKITKVFEGAKKCLVEFEDKSTAIVFFKDLLEEKDDDVTQCHACKKSDTTPSNQLIQCDNCDRDYHQSCHIPPIPSLGDSDNEKFMCRICVFASCAQAGGAKKTGQLAEKYAMMKTHMPYCNKTLTWNATHTSNVEQYYCYCGGPGVWYNKMLQCCRCRQWFHEACIQCLEEDLLLGDRFFIFACAHCNDGEEFIQRMDLSWLDIAYITVFHLVMTAGKRYVDLDEDILPLIMSRAASFKLKKLLNGHGGDRGAICKELSKILRKHTTLFCCGSEVKKRCTYYGIRERIPPCPPQVLIPAHDKITPETVASSAGKRIAFVPIKFTVQVPYVLRGANKVIPPTMGAKLREVRLAKAARVKCEHNYCTPDKNGDDYKVRRRQFTTANWDTADTSDEEFLDANNNSPLKNSPNNTEPVDAKYRNSHTDMKSCTESALDTLSEEKFFWTLDTAFPEPSSFSGPNHPFLTEFEQENLRKQRECFENELGQLSALLNDSDENEDQKAPLITYVETVSPSAVRNIKGFKGELTDIINSKKSSNTSKTSAKTPEESKPNPDKLLDKFSPKQNGISPVADHSPVSSRKSLSENSSPFLHRLSRRSLSSAFSKVSPRNGLPRIESEPASKNCQQSDKLDIAAQKRLKALNRCLKNLSPTCGFRFPVLDKDHPAVVNSHVDQSPLSGKREIPASSSSAAGFSSASKSLAASRLTSLKERGRKRKYNETKSVVDEKVLDQPQHDIENVRRSHRSRNAVKRFEANWWNTRHGYLENMDNRKLNDMEGGQYEVLSLRVGLENKVEYLMHWAN